MNTLSAVTSSDGSLIDLLIGVTAVDVRALRRAGRPVPAPVAVRALLDTGSEITCADVAVLRPLVSAGLTLKRAILANVPALGGMSGVYEYMASLEIVHPSGDPKANLVLPDHSIVEMALGNLGYQALIGRDILDQCLLIRDGPGKSFTLGY